MTPKGGDLQYRDIELAWKASNLTVAVATLTAIMVGLGLATHRWELIAFAMPMLGLLCSLDLQPQTPNIRVGMQAESAGFFENEQIQVTIWIQTDSTDAQVQLTTSVVPGMTMEIVDQVPQRITMMCAAQKWGRYPVAAHLEACARGGLLSGTANFDALELYIFPIAPARSTAIPRTELPDRLGTHVGRRVGSGVEYADIRAYMPGDPLRAVNWPVSARRRALHITERLSEQSADIVVLIDTYPQPPGPATEGTERTVRGSMQVVQTALRRGDRAGIVTLGDRNTRWLAPAIGQRQFYRVLDAVLGSGIGIQTSTSSLAPKPAIPPGAIIIAFSTLLNAHFAAALVDLHRHGHAVVVVDVLRGSPSPGGDDPLPHRIWSLERSFLYRDLRTVGIEVVPWREGRTLDEAMQLIPNRRSARMPT